MMKDTHIQPERAEDRSSIFERLQQTHKERELKTARADPNFNKYMKTRREQHAETKKP